MNISVLAAITNEKYNYHAVSKIYNKTTFPCEKLCLYIEENMEKIISYIMDSLNLPHIDIHYKHYSAIWFKFKYFMKQTINFHDTIISDHICERRYFRKPPGDFPGCRSKTCNLKMNLKSCFAQVIFKKMMKLDNTININELMQKKDCTVLIKSILQLHSSDVEPVLIDSVIKEIINYFDNLMLSDCSIGLKYGVAYNLKSILYNNSNIVHSTYKLYREKMQIRLVISNLTKIDLEYSIIRKIGYGFGNIYFNKLKKCIEDRKTHFISEHRGTIEVYPIILYNNIWVVANKKIINIKLPNGIDKFFGDIPLSFSNPIKWQYLSGTMNYTAHFNDKTVEILCNFLQGCVLYLLNEHETLSINEFSKICELDRIYAEVTMNSIYKSGILMTFGDASDKNDIKYGPNMNNYQNLENINLIAYFA